MRIITISREFGSGGRELGKRLADETGFDYYDREIITAISQRHGMDEEYVEQTLDSSLWRTVNLTFRRSFAMPAPQQSVQSTLLQEQRRVIGEIAQTGRDCIIVGRNADVLLAEYEPFKVFVCADMDAKVRRCIERAEENEHLSLNEIKQNIRRIDKNRARTRELIDGGRWGDREAYHLIVNTTDWPIKELAPAVAAFAARWFGRTRG